MKVNTRIQVKLASSHKCHQHAAKVMPWGGGLCRAEEQGTGVGAWSRYALKRGLAEGCGLVGQEGGSQTGDPETLRPGVTGVASLEVRN